jgi:hypothetical protein
MAAMIGEENPNIQRTHAVLPAGLRRLPDENIIYAGRRSTSPGSARRIDSAFWNLIITRMPCASESIGSN